MVLKELDLNAAMDELKKSIDIIDKILAGFNKLNNGQELTKADLIDMQFTLIIPIDDPDNFDVNTAKPVNISELNDFRVDTIYEVPLRYPAMKITYK